jgi:hypothetical protein
MVCEGQRVRCSSCDPSDASRQRRSSISDSIRSIGSGLIASLSTRSPSADSRNHSEPVPMAPQPSKHSIDLTDSADTRKTQNSTRMHSSESTREPSLSDARKTHESGSNYHKTYDNSAGSCQNCALTIPSQVGASSSCSVSSHADSKPVVLRSRVPYERISSTTSSMSSSMSELAISTPSASDDATDVQLPPSSPSSLSSHSSSSGSSSHSHFISYTSSHEPSSLAYPSVRNSCLRTMSFETLPPAATNPHAIMSMGSAISPQTPNAVGSGGAMFFGDSDAGYTTAFIFRVPDPYARGRRRMLAFICLSRVRERHAMQAFSFLSTAFRDLASWIQTLAEAEADRVDRVNGILPGGLVSARHDPAAGRPSLSEKTRAPNAIGACEAERARLGLMGAGITRSRSLAELVGRPDVFIDLHTRFVTLAAQLNHMHM